MILLSWVTALVQSPGSSFGIAYKGCYQNCSDETGVTSWWPYDQEIEVFAHVCRPELGTAWFRILSGSYPEGVCLMSHLWLGSGAIKALTNPFLEVLCNYVPV